MPPLLERHRVPAVAIARLRRGRPPSIECFGLADPARGLPAGPNTSFEAASLSKPLFAFAVLQAATDGALDLDRPLTDYLPSPYRHAQRERVDEVTDPRLGRITARMVLAHVAGFPNWSLDGSLPIVSAPGERWRYSSEGYVYVQRALERRFGEPLEPFMQRTAFGPLAMGRSSYEAARGEAARGHDGEGRPVDSLLAAAPGAPSTGYERPLAPTSLRTTAADYARFLQRLLDAPDGDPVVSAMLRPETVADGAHGVAWGLGVGLARQGRDAYFFHTGSNPGFRSLALGSRDRGEALLVLSNGDGGRDVALAIARALYGELVLADFITAPRP